MCIAAAPLLLIQTAVGIGSAIAGHVGQQRAAKAQERAIRTGYNNQVAQLENQRREQNIQARTEMSERARQAMIERARLRAASAEGGATGNTMDQIMGANEFAAGQDMAMMSENARNRNRQSAQEGIAMQSRATSELNQIERPSLLSTGLQIAGIAANAGQEYRKIK